MPEKTEPKDLEMVLAKLKEEWRELADLLSSQAKSQNRVIEVEEILLRDASGQYRGKINANPEGSVDLVLSDRAGNPWARLGVNQDGEAVLEVKDQKGESSLKVAVSAPSPGVGARLVTIAGDAAPPAAPRPLESPGVSSHTIMPAAAKGEPPGETGFGPTPPAPGQDLPPGRDANFGVVDRLERLGRQNRRQKIYWALILVVLGVILATQAYVFFQPLSSGLAAVAPNRVAEAKVELVGSKTSNTYHRPTCRWVKAITPWNLLNFNFVREAQARHYVPCPLCKPPPLSR